MVDYNIHKTTNQERKQAMNNVAQKNEKSIVGAIKMVVSGILRTFMIDYKPVHQA